MAPAIVAICRHNVNNMYFIDLSCANFEYLTSYCKPSLIKHLQKVFSSTSSPFSFYRYGGFGY